jgi:hypothetical protein
MDAAQEAVPWTVSENGRFPKRNFHPARKCPTFSLLSLVSSLSSLSLEDFAPQIGLEMALM